jgi:di/tricarboxylate transporter
MSPEQITLTILLSGFILTLLLDVVTTNQALYLTCVLVLSVVPAVSGKVSQQTLLGKSINPIVILLVTLGILAKISETSRPTQWIKRVITKHNTRSTLLLLVIGVVSLTSAVLNNALVVSVMIPIIQDNCRRHNWNSDYFLMPLSFASMLGGTVTLIGSSTNLIAQSLLDPVLQLTMFSLTPVALCCLVVGNIYLWLASRYYFDNNVRSGCHRHHRPGVSVELSLFKIPELSHLIGKTLNQADILSLGEFQLCGIQTGHNFLGRPPRRDQVLGLNDVLIYLGTSSGVEPVVAESEPSGLVKIDTTHMSDLVTPSIAVGMIPKRFSELPGRKYGDIQLKHQYGLVLLAIGRDNTLHRHQLGRTTIKPMDSIIVYGNYPESAITSTLSKFCTKVRMISTKLNPNVTAGLASVHEILVWLGFLTIILVGTFKTSDINIASLGIVIVLYLFQVVSEISLRDSLYEQRNLVLGIIASLVISEAIHQTGLSSYLSSPIKYLPNLHTSSATVIWGSLVIVHFTTSIISLVLSNISVVAIVIPLLRDLYADDTHSLYLLATAVLHGASSCFASPTGYHTNLMVGPVAGYSCRDFINVGMMLHFLTSVTFATVTYTLYG